MNILFLMAASFAVCFAVDKLFTALFRSRRHHRSGRAVRLNKGYAIFGVILMVVGVLALVVGLTQSWPLAVGGVLLICFGLGLTVYYLSFGIYYEADSFLVSSFGRQTQTREYRTIRGQKLYVIQGGSMVVELHFADGTALQLQSTMEGMVEFLNYAYDRWLAQTGRTGAGCDFHDPEKFSWFPNVDKED